MVNVVGRSKMVPEGLATDCKKPSSFQLVMILILGLPLKIIMAS